MGQIAAKLAPAQKPRILLIDDTKLGRTRLTSVLDLSCSHELVTVSTLVQARQALGRARFDLILVDNGAPDGAGTDFALELQAHPLYRSIPLILISDWSTPFMHDKAAQARVRLVLKREDLRPSHIQTALNWFSHAAMPKR